MLDKDGGMSKAMARASAILLKKPENRTRDELVILTLAGFAKYTTSLIVHNKTGNPPSIDDVKMMNDMGEQGIGSIEENENAG